MGSLRISEFCQLVGFEVQHCEVGKVRIHVCMDAQHFKEDLFFIFVNAFDITNDPLALGELFFDATFYTID